MGPPDPASGSRSGAQYSKKSRQPKYDTPQTKRVSISPPPTKSAAQDQAALQAYNGLTRKPEAFLNVAVREIGDKVIDDRSSPSDAILTSGNRPILKPKNSPASSHSHDTQLFIDLRPVQELGLVIDASDASLHSLTKYMEGNRFDLRGIGEYLSSPDLHPNLQCAALQLLEHAAQWQSTNFTECMPVTFGPVANLVLDSREIQVHWAALDTLTRFLESPHATDIVKSMMPRGVVDAITKYLNFSEEPHVQLASVELLEVAVQSKEIFIEFTTAASRIPSALPSMPTATQVTALKVLETSVRADIHDFFKALADELHHLKNPLSSPDATIRIATLKVLEASARARDPELFRAVQTSFPDVEILLSGESDLHSAASGVMEALGVGGYSGQQASLYIANADAALAASKYDSAIELYSAAIDLNAGIDTPFASRCKAKLGKMLWEDALIDAQKVTELNPRSYLGFQLEYAALHGARRYDEAIKDFEVMLSKLDDVRDLEMQALRQQYISPSDARAVIQTHIDAFIEDTPLRLLDTSTGHLCDRGAQIKAFHMSPKYNELLSSIINFPDANLRIQRIHDVVVAFFSYVMLSHRWERKEPSLHEVQDKSIHELYSVEGIMKVQAFCTIVRDSGYRWAWIDTCCIDQRNNVELQLSVNSMFAWYRNSALTIIYLSDVPPSSQSGAMARSLWVTRGWTVQEILAPEIVRFYRNDWSLYLNDRTPNHKESPRIMRELEDATGINGHALTSFRPGMRDSREKLQWASMRVTTIPEDIAYSLFGIFDVHLPVIYGETKQNALGRLLQEIIARSGDINCLKWVGKSSEFNSCLPADITSYAHPLSVLPFPSEDEIQTSISLLQDTGAVELAPKLYTTLRGLPTLRFSHRLHLPCVVFAVTQITLRPSQDHKTYFTYDVKANGLQDLLITTENKLPRKILIRQEPLLVRPWDHNLLELYDTVDSDDDAESIVTDGSRTSRDKLADSKSDSRALRLLVRLGQPFRAFLLARRGSGFSRVAADHDIIAQVKDVASVRDMMNIKTLEIL